MKLLISVIIIASVCMLGAHSLDYSDLEALGQSCPRRDSCEDLKPTMRFSDRNCECDSACAFYKDCCIDAPYRMLRMRSNRNNGLYCLPFGGEPNTGVYVVNTCSREWTGPVELRRKCQGKDDLSDPLNSAPVTDTLQSITYRNRYCAECNFVRPTNLESFQILLSCESLLTNPNITEDYIWSNLEYSAGVNEWGVYSWNLNLNSREFHSCRLVFSLPQYLASNARLCRANVISNCTPGWKRPHVKRSCESYTAVVYGPGDSAFRNPHCALCNRLKVDDFSCDTGVFARKKKPMSFALLLDINQKDGDEVGMRREATPLCASGQKYDPFFKKCRKLMCALPGFVMVEGKCAKDLPRS